MISNVRPRSGQVSRASKFKRARSTSPSSNSYTSRHLLRALAASVQDNSRFHQNLAVCKPLGAARRRPDDIAATRPLGTSGEPLNFSEILRMIQDSLRLKYRLAWHAVAFSTPYSFTEPAEFPNQEELRVRQADGVANGQSNCDCRQYPQARICWPTVDCRQMHAAPAVRDKLLVSRPNESCARSDRPSASRRAFIQIVPHPRTGASPFLLALELASLRFARSAIVPIH